MSTTYRQLSSTGSKIIHFLSRCSSASHLHQIEAQFILRSLHADTKIAYHYINAAERLSVLHPSLPLFLIHLPKPHVFTYNTLVKAFSHSKDPGLPLSLYTHMLQCSLLPNNYTFPFLLKSLSDFRRFKQGQCVHSHLVKWGHLGDIYVLNSLLNLYASCGSMDMCRKVFDKMSDRDVVSWTVLIKGYGKSGKFDDALIAFEMMPYDGVVPNHVTMVNALAACAGSGAIEMGIRIHDFITASGWELDVILGTSLVDMYLKCGRIEEGTSVFRNMKERNLFTWNVLIKGLGLAKCGQEAIWWFNNMEQEGLGIDEITLVNVLTACSHSGFVDVGKQIFNSLLHGKYGFPPGLKHYACVVDLLARAGCLYEALEYIREMPFEPTKSMWGSLLNACKDHGNLELTKFIAEKLVELEPENSAYYVVLANAYAEMGRWNDAAEIRNIMKEKGLKKELGSSLVESNAGAQVVCSADGGYWGCSYG
ncbi:unnamed protein product [Linum tenue]|uniref:Pentatricopeptide repeat-containing protein n=1 Tax=Linum tenue TaxID=586396 RepID=A0AAV0PNK7_9ROSI|nr:unnamed protein product [Linum tenue]